MDEKRDLFAEIGASRAARREEMLIEPQPAEIPAAVFQLDSLDPEAVFTPLTRINTAAKLQRELLQMRRKYSKFLQILAPDTERTRITRKIERFQWRVESPEEFSSDWAEVSIPHYGPPLGRAVTCYRTEFTVEADMLSLGVLFVCFRGVDYTAHVFVNDSYIGSHEGFFAPFEFDITSVSCIGSNTLMVRVGNDAISMGNESWGESGNLYEGDKIYAATGPGYDEPQIGWHHCPPGMGIYQDVHIEARNPLHIHDIFIRPIPEENRAEAWIEVYSTEILKKRISLELSVYGQNFKKTLFENRHYELPGEAGPTINYYRLSFDVPNPKLWDIETPWLYQAQVKLLDADGKILDIKSRQFGIRSFVLDETSEPKGRMYLNSREIRLRGANTMGFEQQDVMKGDCDQLIDDILLAKICHMNFLRLTQRPVQPEVYEMCDRLGLMTQTDLPLFGVIRRNQFAEAVRQAGEMEKLIRSHPCNIMVTYINEPFPDAWGRPHRFLTRPEMESFFTAATQMVKLMNPDRVVKPVEGDYDPPGPGLPDNHCYNGWYNGHGLDLGKLHKGFWQKVKPGWMYGCGEFGSEGLDPVDLMCRHYPQEWLPSTPEEEYDWSPDSIPLAQTGRFHFMWFDTQHSVKDWGDASQAHQAWVTKLMTEAFRRDSRMNSFAIHLFIDAFPAGWMKAIMDFERTPKPAYFTYREALSPVMAHLRADRYAYFCGETAELELWVCNDTDKPVAGTCISVQMEIGGRIIRALKIETDIPSCAAVCLGRVHVPLPNVDQRTMATLRVGFPGGDSSVELDIFATPSIPNTQLAAIGSKAAQLADDLGLPRECIEAARVILVDDYASYLRNEREILQAVENGARLILLELLPNEYRIAGETIKVTACGMGAVHFVSRATGHALVRDFWSNDFRFWFDPDLDRVAPILDATFEAEGWTPILTSGNGDWSGRWMTTLAAAVKEFGKGSVAVCQVKLAGRTVNPVARLFALRLIG